MQEESAEDTTAWWRSRAALVVAGAIVFAAVVIAYVGSHAVTVGAMLATDGLLALVWVGAAALLGGFLMRLTKIEGGGAFGLATAGGLGLGVLSLAALGLGLAGALNRATAIGLLIVAAGVGIASLTADGQRRKRLAEFRVDRWLRREAGVEWLWLGAVVFLALAVVGASILPGVLWKPDDPHPYDVREYHLQVPREWYEVGRITPLRHNVFSYFPFNAEMEYLLAMEVRGGPWAGMYLAQYLNVITMSLAALAVYGAAARGGKGRAWPILGAVLFSTTPWIMMLASTAYDESTLLLYTALAVGWAAFAIFDFRFAIGGTRAMALAGVFAGLACGTKYTAAPMLLAAVPACALVCGGRWRGCAAFVVAGVVAFSPWLARNAAWTRNPVFPLAMRQFGRAHFSVSQELRFERAHRVPAAEDSLAGRLDAVGREVLINWQYGYLIWPLALAAAAARWRRRRTWFLLLLLLCMGVVWTGYTHLISRFLVMTIPVAALLIGSLDIGPIAPIGAVMVLWAAFIGWYGIGGSGIHPRLWRFARQEDGVCIGLDDVKLLATGSPLEGLIESKDTIALVGDAEPFLIPVPMTRLTYRTVFDVDADEGRGVPEAWLPSGQRGPRTDRVLVIAPPELERLAKTYGTPGPPPEMQGQVNVFVRR